MPILTSIKLDVPAKIEPGLGLASTATTGPTRVFHHVWNGFLRDYEKVTERVHPTQKPAALMDWVLRELTKDTERIVDASAGRRATLVAAKKLGRHFRDFEIVAEYCRAARERLEVAAKQSSLLDPVAEQVPLISY
ncbi:MAG TPA: DNA methyltransferase [Terriglobales bacterium]|nr:DNA methyltransferase [Terriglobales bacterium]